MAKPIDDTELLVTIGWEIVDGRASTATGAMRLHGVADASADERRLLRKWKVSGPVILAAMRRAERMRDDALIEGFGLGRDDMPPPPVPCTALHQHHLGYECGWDDAFRLVGKHLGEDPPANVLFRPDRPSSTEAAVAAPVHDEPPASPVAITNGAPTAPTPRPSLLSRMFSWCG